MDELVTLFEALADATRLRLLSLLRQGELCVCHLQAALDVTQPKISRHLAYLRRCGLVETRREGKWVYYDLSPGAKRNQVLSAVFADDSFRGASRKPRTRNGC